MGHMVRWYGPEGSGKSLTNYGLLICAQHYPEIISAQYEIRIKALERMGKKLPAVKLKREMKELVGRFPDGMEACIWDTEQRIDEDFAERLGVNMKRVELLDENVIEEIINDMKAAVEAYHILIVDSVSNAQSYAEANLEPGKYEQGTAAAAWKRLRQVRKVLDREENVIVLVDQMRSALGSMAVKGKSPLQPPQIRFLKHNVSMAVEYAEGGKLYLDKNRHLTDDWEKADNSIVTLGTDGKEVAGLEMRGKIMKNSTGKPFRNFRTRFMFDVPDLRTGELIQEVGFDEPFELLEMAIAFGVIDHKGSGNHVVLDDDGRETSAKWRSAAKTRIGIAEDEELQERILERLLLAT